MTEVKIDETLINIELGKLIKQKRKDEKITQTELGNKCVMHRNRISCIELGLKNIRFSTLVRILRALNVKFSTLDELNI